MDVWETSTWKRSITPSIQKLATKLHPLSNPEPHPAREQVKAKDEKVIETNLP
jgi:hypothetical protein